MSFLKFPHIGKSNQNDITFKQDSLYVNSNNEKRLIRIPQSILSGLDPLKRPEKFVHVLYGIWNSGKSTILEQISLFAKSKGYLVYFSESSTDPNAHFPSFADFNKDSLAQLLKVLEEAVTQKKTSSSFLKVAEILHNSTTNKEIINCLLGLAPIVPVCIVVDRWDLHEESNPVYLAHNRHCMWFLSGTGSWNPKSKHTRYPNNEYMSVSFFETNPINENHLKLLFSPLMDSMDILTISKGVIGFAKIISNCSSKQEAKDVLSDFFRDKAIHVIDKWLESKQFADINDIRKAAAYGTPLVGEKWKQIGFVDSNGNFIHDLLQQSLLDFRLTADELFLAMNVSEVRTEDVFELYVEYLFAQKSTLRISNFSKFSKKRKLDNPRIKCLDWTALHLYNGNKGTIKDRVMYKLSFNRQFPSIDFVLLMDNTYYGIQVSITPTREEHDQGENSSVDDRIQTAKEALKLNEEDEMIYVYLSLDQFKVATDNYFVPLNRDYLDASEGKDDKCYLRLLELRSA
eukprot:NODE_1063_length_2378_cov_0.813076.p1 type:complete len:515 gc:universal NODE_1063_length_2378_cov_0.813076:805-2349(+)